ncbi:MAG: ABC transporter ATP-binding protein [Opitutaceae bacterium]|jgi:lipopolysaccharide transport system ATP-binding protein|nr:ABC transporter ATP-binding protein [Opitutaceae bacterium]
MSEDSVISVQNVSKAYRIWESPSARLTTPLLESVSRVLPAASKGRRWLHHRAQRSYRDFWALQEVSFEIQRGESLGIIGRNGSGKSTLLQIIAGTLQPTTGLARVTGRVAALLELGSGFNLDFTGRENVYLNAAVLGLTRHEVDARFDQIAAFADIGDYIDQPVKTYSSGMFVRLAFAVQTAVEPKILIVDEALSVGDIFFQQRCYERMGQLIDSGVCIILASHDLASVQRFCQKTVVLQRGQMKYNGPATEGTKVYVHLEQQEKIAAYARNNPGATASAAPALTDGTIAGWPAALLPVPTTVKLMGNGWARCTGLAVCDASGTPALLFQQGATLSVFYEFEILQDMEFCVGCITIRDKTTQPVHSKMTLQDGIRAPARVARGTHLRIRQDTVLNLHCADYTVDLSLDMVTSGLLEQPGIAYDEFMAAQLRVCELHSAANISVRLRDETSPFQLLHFGIAGLPSSSLVAALPPVT